VKVDWVRVARVTAFEGRVVDFFRDTVRVVRDGEERESVYDLVHHPGATAVVPLFDDGSVALLHQFRYAVGGEIWEIPAGTLHRDEPFLECARRELEEEIGYRAGRWTPLARFYTSPGFCDEELHVFLAEDLSPGRVGPDPDEHLEVVRVPLAEALAWVESGRIVDAKSIVGLLRARARLQSEGRWPADGTP
jgi:ADP-ribose pyrophosphatase